MLKGETTQSDGAPRLGMSQTTIATWQRQFLEGARDALARLGRLWHERTNVPNGRFPLWVVRS